MTEIPAHPVDTQAREVQRLAHIGSWHWDATTDVTTGSDELLRIFGFDPARQAMPSFKAQRGRCYPVEDWERINAAVQDTLKTGVGYELEVRAFRNESPIWVTTRSEIVRSGDGRIIGLRGTTQDITERKRAEEALRQLNVTLEQRVAERTAALQESAERYRLLTDTAGFVVLLLGRDGTILEWNTEAARIYGYPANEVLGRNYLQLFLADEERRGVAAELERIFSGMPTLGYENAIRARDGGRPTLLWNAALLRDRLGQPVGALSIGSDITERKQAEQRLRANEALTNTVLDSIPAHICVLDEQGDILRINESWKRFAQENSPAGSVIGAVGHNYLDVCRRAIASGDATVQPILCGIEAVLSGRQPAFSVEYPCHSPQQPRWFLLRATRLKDATGIVLSHINITERRQAEETLQATQQRLQYLLTSTPAVIYSVKPPGSGGTTFISANVRQVMGYAPERFMQDSRFWIDRVHPEDLPYVMASMEMAIARREPLVVEYRFLHADGAYRWMRDEARPVLNARGEIEEFIGYWVDVTKRKQAEQALYAHRTEMAQLQQKLIVGHTIAAIAHELNQPLNAIVSYNEAATRLLRAGQDKPERLINFLDKSAAQAQRAGQIMRDLMALLHTHEVTLERVDLAQTIRHAIQAFGAEGDERISLSMDAASDLPAVQAIPAHVDRIMFNLLRNAAEAMGGAGSGGGKVEVHIGRAAEGSHVQVSVRDFGPGVDAQRARLILEPYYTTKARGVGMGLAISRSLVEAQGGKLWLDADVHPGACFCFTVPCA